MFNVTSSQNALDSIQRVGNELSNAASPLSVKGALAWGWHATALLTYMRLQPHRDTFDAWVQEYLHGGEPMLDVERDSHWENRKRLSSLEMLDLLSDVDLPILKPDFYQGWQDRTSRCKTIRSRVAEIVGGSIQLAQRDQLLLLLAAYHRLVRLPAGVSFDPEPVRSAFPAMFGVWKLLIAKQTPGADELVSATARCEAALRPSG